VSLAQQKTLNAILYFVKNTKNCRKTKLFKLLYFLDFIHFKKYGASVTGYDYIAMPRGPVPIELYEQITNNRMPEEFTKAFSVIEEKDDDDESKGFKIILKAKPDMEWFSPNEHQILEEVAFIFKDSTATEISEITHLKNTPWDRTKNEKGTNKTIDYFLALDDETTLAREEIEERFQLQKDLQKNGRL
jgi:uncharacterized phage-associated protein